ncbi:mycofactocin biosynthesis glycosyltransferase MftF [Lapillicoccus sp.]|uniref:mycofactocin biosynthesis glycosyltransferase MftF n=1 Tax=Lapillicoccus sp. TaxID=1909287 RepID=UPI0025FE0F12|nr:mycofactocin biosynthesis glycosyltransferase MftF [Lapillicoccus sp.]
MTPLRLQDGGGAPPLQSTPQGSLPRGYAVRLGPHTKVCDGGRSLLGTSTGRLVYLKPRAAALLDDDLVTVTDGTSAALARLLLDRDLVDPWWPDRADDSEVSDVVVVVPVRDRPAQLDRLLGALPPQVRVVVVDDGSTDEESTARIACRHGATVVRHEVSRGPAAARNTGFRAADAAYVAFLDSDVVPQHGWLAALRRHFDDPLLGLVAPRVLGLAPDPAGRRAARREARGWLHRYEAARSSLDLGDDPASVRPHGQVAYLPSAALMVRREAWGSGFDEDLRVGEDVDLVWRTHEAGWRIRYEPAAVVRHEHRTDVSAWLSRKAFYGTSADLLAARHGDAVAPMVLNPWTAVFAGALLAQRRWSIPVAAAAYAVTTLRISRRLQRSDSPVRTAASLTAVGAVASLWQTASALNRHYWPVSVAAAVVSRRARRALLVAALAEALLDHHRTRSDLDPLRYLVARRLDDLAYGSGVWLGAWRGRSLRALRPAVKGFDHLR